MCFLPVVTRWLCIPLYFSRQCLWIPSEPCHLSEQVLLWNVKPHRPEIPCGSGKCLPHSVFDFIEASCSLIPSTISCVSIPIGFPSFSKQPVPWFSSATYSPQNTLASILLSLLPVPVPWEIPNLGLVWPLHSPWPGCSSQSGLLDWANSIMFLVSYPSHKRFQTLILCGGACPIPVYLCLSTYLTSYHTGQIDNIRQRFQRHIHLYLVPISLHIHLPHLPPEWGKNLPLS